MLKVVLEVRQSVVQAYVQVGKKQHLKILHIIQPVRILFAVRNISMAYCST